MPITILDKEERERRVSLAEKLLRMYNMNREGVIDTMGWIKGPERDVMDLL